ncbi:hypothetical protein RLO149_c040330 [Roseobacter litoralis Och 149]|uniref:Transmembrane protein n=1 Tax=Roseobacter litoralis (strain ATCC 49566 / DSM 6996 / JCM 21268 / NBRC 15278 / OCh 149) TaxID=391595 RepID=F7ZEN5_ROSLO|nr:hypothetical protein RLO149_c040330 [Roseobacter litoralis Och 149]
MKFHDLDDAYEKRPIITGILVLASHFSLSILVPWLISVFPDHADSIVTIFLWVWLAWMIISGVATIKYLEKIIKRKK